MAAPLTSVIGYAQLNLEDLGSPEELREDFGEIEQSAKSLRIYLRRLSRLSRYLPEESTTPAGDLFADLEALTNSLALSAGNVLVWNLNGTSYQSDEIEANPWLVRVTCLALLGAVCRFPSANITVTRTPDSITIKFPALQDDRLHGTPNAWGCGDLGHRLLASQPSLLLETGEEHWTLSLPRRSSD